jgi:hypothetical protein
VLARAAQHSREGKARVARLFVHGFFMLLKVLEMDKNKKTSTNGEREGVILTRRMRFLKIFLYKS